MLDTNAKWISTLLKTAILAMASVLVLQGCTKEKIIYRDMVRPGKITKLSPVNGDTLTAGPPVLIWSSQQGAVEYQVQVNDLTDFYAPTYDIATTDTFVVLPDSTGDNRYYWRVRAMNADDLWGDWSDESIWNFLLDAVQSPVRLVGMIQTYGYAQDVTVVNERNRAYVADGQAELTVVDITDKSNPSLVGNLNIGLSHDFTKAVFVAPGDSFAYVADMDGRIQIFSMKEPLLNPDNYVATFGSERNMEEVVGRIINDTLYILGVSTTFNNRQVLFYQVPYNPLPDPTAGVIINATLMYADCNGLDFSADSNYLAIANDELGLQMIDITDILNPSPAAVGSVDFAGSALSVQVRGNYAYLAADWTGLWIVDISTPTNPVIVANFETTGRSKDVALADSFAFIADGGDGLKVANIANVTAPQFVAAYTTPYAYGIWADENYVYLADRDWGLLIFERID